MINTAFLALNTLIIKSTAVINTLQYAKEIIVIPEEEPCSCMNPNSSPPCHSCSNPSDEANCITSIDDAFLHMQDILKYLQATKLLVD